MIEDQLSTSAMSATSNYIMKRHVGCNKIKKRDPDESTTAAMNTSTEEVEIQESCLSQIAEGSASDSKENMSSDTLSATSCYIMKKNLEYDKTKKNDSEDIIIVAMNTSAEEVETQESCLSPIVEERKSDMSTGTTSTASIYAMKRHVELDRMKKNGKDEITTVVERRELRQGSIVEQCTSDSENDIISGSMSAASSYTMKINLEYERIIESGQDEILTVGMSTCTEEVEEQSDSTIKMSALSITEVVKEQSDSTNKMSATSIYTMQQIPAFNNVNTHSNPHDLRSVTCKECVANSTNDMSATSIDDMQQIFAINSTNTHSSPINLSSSSCNHSAQGSFEKCDESNNIDDDSRVHPSLFFAFCSGINCVQFD